MIDTAKDIRCPECRAYLPTRYLLGMKCYMCLRFGPPSIRNAPVNVTVNVQETVSHR